MKVALHCTRQGLSVNNGNAVTNELLTTQQPSGSGVKRAHGESIVNDDEEHPGTRARISNLIAGLRMLRKMMKFAMVTRFLMNGCPHGTLRRT